MSATRRVASPPILDITPRLLRAWPLPQPGGEADKDSRGRVLVIAGAREMPGAALLAAVAALRAGAGKLQIATTAQAAPLVAAGVPEARVIALPETRGGAFAAAARARLDELAERADAIVVGPGMLESDASARMLAHWLCALPELPVVVDAAALAALEVDCEATAAARAHVILTPHAGEIAALLRCTRESVSADPLKAGHTLAARYRGVTVIKGATTHLVDGSRGTALPKAITRQAGAVLRNRYGNPGLATSGSGDTLAGIIGGLAARGASPLQAAAWGVHLHAAAGDRLAARIGPLGFLARELLDEIPAVLTALSRPARAGG